MPARHEHRVVEGRRLGKARPRRDPRTLQLHRYLVRKALPPAPASLHLERAVSTWPMYGNDRYGDCVFADIGHQEQLWTASVRREVRVADADVLAGYSAVTGFDPSRPDTDQGTVWLDALNWWRKAGIAGHRIVAYASVAVARHDRVKIALDLFEGVQLGLSLPISAEAQVGRTWTVGRGANGRAGSWGGHAVPVVAYDRYHLWCVTWGALQAMTWGFLDAYCDEAYVALSQESIDNATAKTPLGFDFAALQADLAQIGA